jgi:hypothetical protein
MGDVVALRPGDGTSSNYRLPDWPHPRKITLTIKQARSIDRDLRHLDAVMERALDTRAISTILSTICGVEDKAANIGARVLQRWLSTGRIG